MGHEPEVTGGTGGGRRRALVDGMNLIGSRPDRWWNDRDGAVHRLVGELDRFAAATGEDVTVVFDRRPPDLDPGRHGAVEVAFASRRGRDAADHEIVAMVAADPEPGQLPGGHLGPAAGRAGARPGRPGRAVVAVPAADRPDPGNRPVSVGTGRTPVVIWATSS